MRMVLAVLVTAAICSGAYAATSRGSTHHANHYLTARAGDSITIRGVDLFCSIFATDPDHRESGPVMFCKRNSSTDDSRALSLSRYHYEVSDETGNYVVYRIERAP